MRPRIGQRIQLSSGDIRQANKLYSCPGKCSIVFNNVELCIEVK